MKKNLFFVLAVAGALASCSNDETLEVTQQQQSKTIGFNSYVDKATRADVDEDALKASGFNVWGQMKQGSSDPVAILTNEDVTWSASKWTYSTIRYWLENTKYAFTAIGPKDAAGLSFAEGVGSDFQNNLHGTITMNNGEGAGDCDVDLVYAYNTRTTTGFADADEYAVVPFTFNHILSKVQVQFTNGFSATAQKILVSGVKVCSLPTGNLTLTGYESSTAVSSYAWTPSGDEYAKACTPATLNGGSTIEIGANASTNPIYLIPNQETIHIEFVVQLYNNTTPGNTYTHNRSTKRGTATITGGLKPGYSYILTASIDGTNIDPDGGLKPIEFTVESVKGWTDATPGVDVTL